MLTRIFAFDSGIQYKKAFKRFNTMPPVLVERYAFFEQAIVHVPRAIAYVITKTALNAVFVIYIDKKR